MKLNKLIIGIASAGLISAIAVPAQATVLDAWKMVIGGTTYNNIGRLSLTAGSATVEQEVNGLGQVFTGARFNESTIIYSISFVQDSVVGPNDVGAPTLFGAADALKITVNPTAGQVTSLTPGGGFTFNFLSGNMSVQTLLGGIPQATGVVTGIGGNFNLIAGFAGGNGSSILDSQFTALLNGFTLKDSANNLLDINNILFEAHTNNQVGNGPGSVTGPHACSFDATANCLDISVNSNGDAYLTNVPEPETVALLGLGLLGLGFSRRRHA